MAEGALVSIQCAGVSGEIISPDRGLGQRPKPCAEAQKQKAQPAEGARCATLSVMFASGGPAGGLLFF